MKQINLSPRDCEIGDNVWVGHGCKILKGSKIPNNTAVGAGSIVNKLYVKENTIIAGIPAKVVRENIIWKE